MVNYTAIIISCKWEKSLRDFESNYFTADVYVKIQSFTISVIAISARKVLKNMLNPVLLAIIHEIEQYIKITHSNYKNGMVGMVRNNTVTNKVMIHGICEETGFFRKLEKMLRSKSDGSAVS